MHNESQTVCNRTYQKGGIDYYLNDWDNLVTTSVWNTLSSLTKQTMGRLFTRRCICQRFAVSYAIYIGDRFITVNVIYLFTVIVFVSSSQIAARVTNCSHFMIEHSACVTP